MLHTTPFSSPPPSLYFLLLSLRHRCKNLFFPFLTYSRYFFPFFFTFHDLFTKFWYSWNGYVFFFAFVIWVLFFLQMELRVVARESTTTRCYRGKRVDPWLKKRPRATPLWYWLRKEPQGRTLWITSTVTPVVGTSAIATTLLSVPT